MTTTKRTGITRFRCPLFPSVVLSFFAFLLWLRGPSELPLLPWLCLASAIVTARHIFFEAKFPSFFTWFTVSYIGLFLIYPITVLLIGMEIPTSNEVFTGYCFLAVGGLHLFIVGYELAWSLQGRRRWDVRYPMASDRLLMTIFLLLVLNIFALLLCVANAGSFSTLQSQTRVEMKLHVGLLSLIGFYLLSFGSLLYPLVAIYVRDKRSRALLWLPALVAMEVFIFLAWRVRTFVVIHAVGLLVGWFLISPRLQINRSQSKRSLRVRLTKFQKMIFVGFAVILIMGMFILRAIRGQFEKAESLAEINIDLVSSILYAFEGGGELGYSKHVFHILEIVPDQHGYLCGQSYYRLLFLPIPRPIWPDKPFNTQRIMAQWLNPRTSSVQTTPVGIIGDLYVNFGMAGILGMLVFGYVFGRLDRSSDLVHALLLSISFAMIFHFVRGGFTNPLLNFVTYYVAVRFAVTYLSGGLPMRSATPSAKDL